MTRFTGIRAALATAALAAVAAVAVLPAGAATARPGDFADGSPDVVSVEPNLSPRPMCEVSGLHYCARDKNNAGTPSDIVNANNTPGPAENAQWQPNGNTFTWNGHSYHTGLLVNTAHNACLDDQVVLVPCDSTGTVWAHGYSNGDVWIARFRTGQDQRLDVLSSDNILGDRLFVDAWIGRPDNFKRWSS